MKTKYTICKFNGSENGSQEDAVKIENHLVLV